MRDGNYDLRFSADGFESRGSLRLSDGKAEGGADEFRIEGDLFDGPGQISAVFNVLMPPRLIGNTRLPEHFSLRMTGATNDHGFSLIGTGPLGVIVEIGCTHAGTPPPDRRGN